MKIEMPKEAEKCFNDKIRDFLYELKPDKTPRKREENVESSASHVFIAACITERDILSMPSFGYSDPLSGRQVARYFPVENTRIGLDSEAYAKFDEYVEKLHQRREVRRFLSDGFVRDCAFDYFERRYKGILPEGADFIPFLVQRAEEAIRPLKVSIPISFLAIQRPFSVGAITFEYFTRDFFDHCISRRRAATIKLGDFEDKTFHLFERRFREQYQGAVFASATIEAEQRRCIEIAKSDTEKALAVLRFFAPSAFIPEIPCYFGMMGHTSIVEDHAFVFEEDTPTVIEGTDEKRKCRWDLGAEDVQQLFEWGLSTASHLLLKEKLTEFEELTLNCMSLFGRSLTSTSFQDKIVYALVSIETLLLRNETEPIQSNLGLRLAFLTKTTPQDRRDIKDLVASAYKTRSAYVHHGRLGQDWRMLQDLQHAIWTAIRGALLSSDQFPTQKDYLDRLELTILS